MLDLLLVMSVIIFVVLVMMAVSWHQHRNDCKHEWGQWRMADTTYAFVQLRACAKCGLMDIQQTPKIQKKETLL